MRYIIAGLLSCFLLIGCVYSPKEADGQDSRSAEQTKAFIEQAQDIKQFYSVEGREIQWDEDLLKGSLSEFEKSQWEFVRFKNAVKNASILE